MSRPPTSAYRHWSGRTVPGNIPMGDILVDTIDGYIYLKQEIHPLVQFLGSGPVPRNRWEWFWFDWHSGRLMRYDLLSVLAFCFARFKDNNRGRVEASQEARDAQA